jgi:putative transposase
MIQSAEQLAETVGVLRACQALDVPRSGLYRMRPAANPRPVPEPLASPRALLPTEKAEVRHLLNSDRFQDQAPREVYATLLDEGKYLCSWRTMYRILDENHEVRERRDQLQHPQYTKPELLATQPNRLWSWDTPALAPQVQVSPNCWDRQNGPIITCTTFWTSSAVIQSAG